MAEVVSKLFGHRPESENPTLREIEARPHAERTLAAAAEAAKATQHLARESQQRADQAAEATARRRSQIKEAENVAKRAEELARAANAARREQELAEAAFNAAREKVERLSREAREEQERARKMQEDAERAMAIVKEEAEKAQQAADAQRREAEAAEVRAKEMARTAAEETRKVKEAGEDAERRSKEGIQHIVMPSPEELAVAKKGLQYREDCFHFAVTGIPGSGKSSLVNAFRGLSNGNVGAAAAGVTEMTLQTTRYPDQNPENRLVWYDVPGVVTLKCRGWQHFNDQGLYVFDCIIVLFDNRFTMTDIAILTNARRFKIPTYIVRSKADQHIRNVMREKGYDSNDDEAIERRDNLYKAARKQVIDMTRKQVQDRLKDANLPDQRVYIVSTTALLSVLRDKVPKNTIDEIDLLNDLINEAHARRKAGR